MSLIITKIISALVMSITAFYTVRNFLGKKTKLFKLDNLLYTAIIAVPLCTFYEEKYNALNSLVSFIVMFIVFKKIFNITTIKAIIVSSIFMIFIVVLDLIVTSIEMLFISLKVLRTNVIIILLNNISIGIITVLLSKINFISQRITNFCLKIDKNEYLPKLIYAILSVIIIAVLYYNATTIFKLNVTYAITIVSILTFITLYYFFIEEHNKYNTLNNEYNILFEYVQNFEDWIDDEQLHRHEFKNNLSIIRGMTEKKQVMQKIDEMLRVNIIIDEQYIEILKYIPKGGLKGLLYYKIALAKKYGVKMIIDVSNKVTPYIKKLSKDELKQLSILIGIYLDNAIDAANTSSKKIVTLEIYILDDNINFVISNTYKEMIPLKSMRKKGFSTKGKNHGKGLYYANKVLNKTKWLESEQMFLNQYFIQKIAIKKFVK